MEAFRGLGDTLWFLFIVCCISAPLALWKCVDIIIWICNHVRFV